MTTVHSQGSQVYNSHKKPGAVSIEKPAISTLTIKGRFESVTAARQASILKARVRPPLEAPTNKGPPVAKQLKPCEVELGRCCFIDHWAGCWEKGHEPHDRDERKCPTSAAAVDDLYDRVCDRIVERGRRAARRASGAVRSPDGRVRGDKSSGKA